jgi:uncharacterized membrane protein YtjA (UPF0391 family)
MLHWALVFFVIAVVLALLGFRQAAGMSYQIGYLFAVIAIVFLLLYFFTGHAPRVP